jgi:hypothetical protein
MVERRQKGHPPALRIADQWDGLPERREPASDRPDRRRNVNRMNPGIAVPRQVGGVYLEGVAGERRKLGSRQREAMERGNTTSGSIDPDGKIGRGLISLDPRPGLRPSLPCRS